MQIRKFIGAPLLTALLAGAFALALAGSAQAATNLVTNGGFEAGSLAGWSGSVLSSPYSGAYCPGAGSTAEGNCEAFLGTDGSVDTLSQLLSTVAGQTYAISFSLGSDGSTPTSFSVSFGGQSLYQVSDLAAAAPQTLTFLATATGSSTALSFSYQNDPGYFTLDAVSATAAAPVPEPASLVLSLAGLIGLAAKRRWSASFAGA